MGDLVLYSKGGVFDDIYSQTVYLDFTFLGNRYVLKMRVIDHIYDDFVVDDLSMRIILPEGCT